MTDEFVFQVKYEMFVWQSEKRCKSLTDMYALSLQQQQEEAAPSPIALSHALCPHHFMPFVGVL